MNKNERHKNARWVTGRRARTLLCASGVSFMLMLDSNIVAVSLPTIARDLHAGFADIEWVVSAYVLTFAALLMPAGALADRFGRRRLLILGLTVFTCASFLCGLAPNAPVLNAARALQGVGAALQLSAALAVLGTTFSGPDRARAFGFWGTVMGVAVAAGPPVGGVITSAFGWRWAFLVNIPIGLGLIALTVESVDESKDPQAGRLDMFGMLFFSTALFALIWAFIDANTDGWTSFATSMKLGAAALFLIAYVIAELVQERPMVDFGLFAKRTFLGSSFAMLGFASAAQVMMTYLPLYLQNFFGFSPVAAGLGMLPFALPLFFFPRIAVASSQRISGRMLLTIGLCIVSAGNLLTASLITGNHAYPAIAFGMFLMGCGAGLLNGETAKVSMSVIPPERGGMASGIGGTLRFVGLVTGIAGLGSVLSRETERHFADLASTTSLSLSPTTTHFFVARLVAGDIAGLASGTGSASRTLIVELSRRSFAMGFSNVLFVAAAVSAVAAVMTYVLVSAVDTAPVRENAPSLPPLPEVLD